MSEPEAVRLLERILATTTNEINGHKVWRQVATGKAKEWTAAIEDAAMFLNNRRAFGTTPMTPPPTPRTAAGRAWVNRRAPWASIARAEDTALVLAIEREAAAAALPDVEVVSKALREVFLSLEFSPFYPSDGSWPDAGRIVHAAILAELETQKDPPME